MEEAALRDALRYAGVKSPTDEEMNQMAALWERLFSLCPPRHLYRVCTLKKSAEGVWLSEADILLPGALAGATLSDCGQAALLICTLGAGFEGQMRQMQARDMRKALLWDGCGSAAVEAGCDEAERQIAGRFPSLYLTDRFSPGYGDLPLSLQPAILRALDAEKRLGVHAAASCLLIPAKTVTAVVGLSHTPQPARIRGCEYCGLRDHCAVKKGGDGCGRVC